MQDRYTGDIGDFAKYGLLRYILDRVDMTLGINWYLVPDEAHNEAKTLILLLVSSYEILSLILSFEDTNALLIGSGVLEECAMALLSDERIKEK